MAHVDKKYQQLAGCSCNAVREAARTITQFYEGSLREANIKPTQFNILATLANTGPIALSQLANILSIERTGLTRNLNVLERNDWIAIQSGERDSRQRISALSENGYKQLDRAIPYWEKAQSAIAEGMGMTALAKLKKDLSSLKKTATA